MKGTKKCLLLLLPLLLWGCAAEAAAPEPVQPTAVQTEPMAVPTIDPALELAAMTEPPLPAVPVVPMAEASGLLEQHCEEAVVDYSHAEDGYVMVQYTGETDKRLKVQVSGPRTTYTYNLPQQQWTVFPLSDGDGSYQVSIYKNVTGTRYALVMSASVPAALTDEFAPFLRPNQYVDYSEATNAVALGLELTAGLEAPLEKVAAVYDYVVTNFTYDYEKAETVKSGYLPVLDQVLEEKRGICFDYAALMTAMLRSQEIPCKLVVGYAGSTYHAWISVWTEENGWIDGAVFFDGHVWKRLDPTFASSNDRSQEIMEFIENGNYTVKYLY